MILSEYKIFKSELRKHSLSGNFQYFFRWMRSHSEGESSLKDEQPWITYKVIDYLKGYLKPEHNVFEYGGGGSTLFFVNRVVKVVTVEHQKEWFNILTETINKKKFAGWTGKYIGPNEGELVHPADHSNPLHYSSGDEPSKGYNYKAYVSAIDEYPEGYFDCVLIDGRSRPACIVHAIPKIKNGGLLILDNSDRDYYLPQTRRYIDEHFKVVIDEFGPSPYSRDFTKTTVWKKKQ
jgi:hypothetical protein